MNKKGGSIAITLFVLIFIVLFGATLFSLLQNVGKVTAIVENAKFVDEAYAKEKEIEFYVKFTGEKVVEELYALNVNNGEEEIVEAISQFFSLTFQSEVRNMNQNDIPLKDFAEKVEKGEFKFIYNEDRRAFEFEMKDFAIIGDLVFDEGGDKRWFWREQPEDYSEQETKFVAGIIYRADIDVEFSLGGINENGNGVQQDL